MPGLSEKELLERLRLCETIIFDMADLTRPCRLYPDMAGQVCEHVPNRIINTRVGCVFGLALNYVKRYEPVR